jgi:Ca2+-binding EF-hand superfamily protein
MKTKTLMIAALLTSIAVTAVYATESDGDGNRAERMQQKMQEHMKAADTNNDGKISKAEFLQQAEVRFKKMDSNGDGGITKEELEAMRKKFHKARSERHDSGESTTP